MSKLKLHFPFDVKAKCRITGFTGTIIARQELINGAVQYALQPRSQEDSSYVPDAKSIDEGYIVLCDGRRKPKTEIVTFKFECGEKVENLINGFKGTITKRAQWLNGCIQYVVEGQMVKTELQGMISQSETFWEQELKSVGKSANIKKSRTGGPTTIFNQSRKKLTINDLTDL